MYQWGYLNYNVYKYKKHQTEDITQVRQDVYT